MKRRIKAILFDLDDTLVHSSLAYKKALSKIRLAKNQKSYLQARKKVKARVGKDHVVSHNRLLYFKEMLDSRSAFSSSALLKGMDQYERQLSIEIRKQWVKLKRERLIKKLASRFRLVIVSNENTRTQLIKMNAIDPKGRLFKRIVTSEEVGVEKPHPAVFKKALEGLSLSFRDCLMVGDSWTADILPAKKLGCHVAWTQEFVKDKRKSGSRPVSVLKTLDQLLSYLNL